MNLVLLGQQGSGKGTQANLLSERHGFYHAEGGNILRQIAKTDARIKKMISQGKLVPDQEMLEIYEQHIEDEHGRYEKVILDGYPRTVSQYGLAKEMFESHGSSLNRVVFIEISDAETVKRLSSRRVCSECGETYNLITNPPPKENACECGGNLVQREDDKPEAIKKRLAIYKNRTYPIVELAESDGILIRVNGEEEIESIYKNITSKLGL